MSISCFALATELRSLHQQYGDMDEQSVRFAPRSAERQTINDAMQALFQRMEAIQALILATPAERLADVAALVMIAAHEIGMNRFFEPDEDCLLQIERSLRGALGIIAENAGISLSDIGMSHYS
ncbi:Hypothetical protein GbCGDNIH3_7044 [Granulibacter bethesdensis]|uniref:Uncharacterized protein n=1 Tax=Granulibacter bethesdensis TaxID=364410 RepID=A0AAN0RE98_9PROT|nr:hypothetical protein [Granulibacter bethesdensis]AHJ63266.1 Hypothetical protein GbCGDNIH3_7044 [Granulibacter bethesdensis]